MPGIIGPTGLPQSQAGGDWLGSFVHWLIHGRAGTQGGGLNSVPGQVAQMFNPTTKQGLVGLAGLLAGGVIKGASNWQATAPPTTFEEVSGFKSPAELIQKSILSKMSPQEQLRAQAVMEHQQGLTAGERAALDAEKHRGDTEFDYGEHGTVYGNHRPMGLPPGVKPGQLYRIGVNTFINGQQIRNESDYTVAVLNQLIGHGLFKNPQEVPDFITKSLQPSVRGEESRLVTPREAAQPGVLEKLTGGDIFKANPARTKALQQLLKEVRQQNN